MTIINPNSIAGITSVTAQADIINFYKSDGTPGSLQIDGCNFNTTTGISTFNNVYVGGTITYEDVKNVDSVGIITARTGLNVTAGDVVIPDKIVHAGDTNTAIRFPANDTFSVETAGQQNVQVNGTRVLLKSPSGTDTTVRLQHQGNSGYGDIILDRSVNAFIISNDPSNASSNQSYFSVKNKGVENLRIASDGKIGIGVAAPGELLHLKTASGNCKIRIDAAATPSLDFYEAGTRNSDIMVDYSSNNLIVTNRQNANITFRTNGTNERLRITSGGAVQVNGGAVHLDANGELAVFETDTNLAFTNSSKLCFDFSSNVARIRSSINGSATIRDIGIYTGNSERLRIDTSGNIGLGGITSPLWTTGGGMHLNDAYGIGFGNGGSGRPDFQIVTTVGATLDFRCGFGADTADIVMNTSGYLGIGDASPTKPLTVGTATPVVLLDDQSSRTLEIRGPSTTHNATILTTSNHDLLLGTNNTERLRITSGGNVQINQDSKFLQIGVGQDLDLHHNGTNSYIRNKTGNLHIRPLVNEEGIILKPNGEVELYYDNNLKLSTGNNGINVSGSIALGDSSRYYFGSSNDAYLYHDGTNTHFVNSTGALQVRQLANSSIQIQTNGSERLRITSDGILSWRSGLASALSGTGNPYSLNIYRDSGSGYGFLDCLTGSSNHTGWKMRVYHNGTYGNVIAHATSDYTWFETGGSERLRIHTNGKISTKGITNPQGVFCIDTGSGATQGNTLELRRDSTSDYHAVSFFTGTTCDWSIGQNSAGDFEIFEDGSDSTTRLSVHTGGTVQVQNHLTSRNGIVQINQVTTTTRWTGTLTANVIEGSSFTPKTSDPRFLIMIFCPVNTSDDSDAANQNTNPYYYGRIEYQKNGGSWTECNNQGSTSNQGGSAAHIELSPNRTGDSTTDYWSGNRYRMEHKQATVLVTNVGDCGTSGNVKFKLRVYAQHQNFLQIGQPHGYSTDDNYPVQPWGFTVFELAPDSNSYTAY